MAHLNTYTQQLVKSSIRLAAWVLLALFSQEATKISTALAIVILEQDFETQGNCSTGREDTCWIDNNFDTGNAAGFPRGTIKGDGAAALGSGYFEIGLPFGGASTGRINIDTTDATEVRWGMFVKFSDTYQFYTETHGIGMRVTGDSSCDMGGNLEISNGLSYYFAEAGSCGITGANHAVANTETAASVLKGGRWYWIEQHIKIDDSCSDSISFTGCNGVYQLWVDGILWSDHSNLNLGGVLQNAVVSTLSYEHYFHVGMPGHWTTVDGNTTPGPKMWIDNVVVRNDNTEIGIPEGVTQGTANTTPYFVWHTANNFVAHQYNDCTLSSFTNQRGFNYGSVWRTNGNATSQTATPSGNDGYPPDATECTSQEAATDAYMEVTTASGDGGGVVFGRASHENGTGTTQYYQDWFIHGYMYLPSGNDYTNVLYSGLRSYNCYSGCCDGSCAPWGRVIAMSVNTGKWAIARRWDTATSTYHTSATDIVEDEWVEFEFRHDRTGELATLKINGTLVVEADLTGVSQDIMQDPGGDGGGGIVVGTIDYIGTGSNTAYFDDITVSSVSPTSCDGWDSGTCPYDEIGATQYTVKFGFRELEDLLGL